MIRRTILTMIGALLGALVVPALPALAGGGCHSGVTTGTDTTVRMVDACFTPTIVSVDPGGTVTFVNEDPMTHNVTANLWGNFEDMDEGERFSVTFDEEGTYPYACTYHPGMTGAVVVGDGDGPGNGEVAEVTAITGPTGSADEATDPEGAVEASPVGATRPAEASATGWVGGAAIGLAIGLGAGLLVTRRRRTV